MKTTCATYDIRRIDLKKHPEQLGLLEQAYEEIYLPAFPIPEERQTLAYLRDCLTRGLEAPREYIFIAAGKDLDIPAQANVSALGIGIYYKKSQSALMAYNAVRQGVHGLGRTMVQERLKAFDAISLREGHTLRGVFLEANDPFKVADDVMDPHKRIAKFKNWGAECIPIDYTQPPLDPTSTKYDNLILLNYPTIRGRRPSARDTIAFLQEMYIACGTASPDDDRDFQRMKKQLLSLEFNASTNCGLVEFGSLGNNDKVRPNAPGFRPACYSRV